MRNIIVPTLADLGVYTCECVYVWSRWEATILTHSKSRVLSKCSLALRVAQLVHISYSCAHTHSVGATISILDSAIWNPLVPLFGRHYRLKARQHGLIALDWISHFTCTLLMKHCCQWALGCVLNCTLRNAEGSLEWWLVQVIKACFDTVDTVSDAFVVSLHLSPGAMVLLQRRLDRKICSAKTVRMWEHWLCLLPSRSLTQ